MYTFMAEPILNAGMIAVIIGYDLAPDGIFLLPIKLITIIATHVRVEPVENLTH